MNIGRPKRIIEIEPATLPLPDPAMPMPDPVGAPPEQVPSPIEPPRP